MRKTLEEIYERLEAYYGPTGWWPGETGFEIAVGAILTQNTAWTNVEKALAELKAQKLLGPHKILKCPLPKLEKAIRSSGYFRQKAKRLQIFCDFLVRKYRGSVERMAQTPLEPLREQLLALHGIGPETADDILLYACHQPVFVVDAYTRRILARHGLVPPKIGYEELRRHFETNLPRDVALFQEYHGLIVFAGKDFCRSQPQCAGCPLAPMLPPDGPQPL